MIELYKKIPVALRNTFWKSFMSAVEEEIQDMRKVFDQKRYMNSVLKSERVDLYDFSRVVFRIPFGKFSNLENSLRLKYGFTDTDIENLLRRELQKIPFQTTNKGSAEIYPSIFNLYRFSFPFQISLYNVVTTEIDPITGGNLIKRDLRPLLEGAQDFREPYSLVDGNGNEIGDTFGVLGIYGYTPHILQKINEGNLGEHYKAVHPSLDMEEDYTLDDPSSPVTMLDTQSSLFSMGTKHIALEVVATNKYWKEGGYVLFPYDIFQYIKENVMYYKRATEVPHIGIQYSVLIDNTGYWDLHSSVELGSNLIENHDFNRDRLWIKGSGWTILDGIASRQESDIPSSLVYPSLSGFEGDMLRFTVVTKTVNGELVVKDGSGAIVQTIYNSGVKEFDVLWTTNQSGFSLESDGTIEIESITVSKANRFSNPDTYTRTASNRDLVAQGLDKIAYVEFGTGVQELPRYDDPIYNFPTSLARKAARVNPLSEELFNKVNPNYLGSIATYTGQLISDLPLHTKEGPQVEGSGTFDGITKTFTGFIPKDFTSLKPGTTIFGLRNLDLPEEDQYIDYIEDTGSGILIGRNRTFYGTLDYTTGEYNISSEFLAPAYINQVDMEVDSNIIEASIAGVYAESDSSFQFTYQGTDYLILIDGNGNLSSNFPHLDIGSSSVAFNVNDFSYHFEFTTSVRLTNRKFILNVAQDIAYPDTHMLELYRSYSNSPLSITEMGIYGTTVGDPEVKLLAYTSCAPIELFSNDFHLSFGVVLEK